MISPLPHLYEGYRFMHNHVIYKFTVFVTLALRWLQAGLQT